MPATVEWVVEEVGLQLYSAGIVPAKGGPVLRMGANYPYKREDVEPLTEEESDALRKRLKESLLKKGYKSKVLPFSYKETLDFNDFRLKVILKAKDINPEHYATILRLWKERRAREFLPEEPPKEIWGGPLRKLL